jgi:hypothetical protein
MKTCKTNSPKQVKTHKIHRIIITILQPRHEHHAHNTRKRRQPARAQDQADLELLVHGQAQRPRRGDGQQQNGQIRDGADDRVGRKDGALVEARRRVTAVPVGFDGLADKHLDKEDGQVVECHDDDEHVRQPDGRVADEEDALDDEYQRQLGRKGRGAKRQAVGIEGLVGLVSKAVDTSMGWVTRR